MRIAIVCRAKPEHEAFDLHALGARVISVFGPFSSRVLIDMSAEKAAELFPEPLGTSGRTDAVDAVERDLERIRQRAPELAESALAASALRLAYELEHPYNSATSKSMCARELRETMKQLRELAPPEEKRDGIDELGAARDRRRAGDAVAANPART